MGCCRLPSSSGQSTTAYGPTAVDVHRHRQLGSLPPCNKPSQQLSMLVCFEWLRLSREQRVGAAAHAQGVADGGGQGLGRGGARLLQAGREARARGDVGGEQRAWAGAAMSKQGRRWW